MNFTIFQCHEKDRDNDRHRDREIERERDKEREIYSNRKSHEEKVFKKCLQKRYPNLIKFLPEITNNKYFFSFSQYYEHEQYKIQKETLFPFYRMTK